jgi:hypothetical protein
MGCNCGKRAGGVARTTTGAAGDSTTRRRVAGRTRVRFYAVPPPEDAVSEEIGFETLFEARRAVGQREGWRVDARREPVGG